jgi:hypothetical protein
MVVAVVIALVSTAALLAFAARQSPGRTASARHWSRAAVNAAEESAIWAPPKTDPSQAQAAQDSTITGCLEQQGDRFRLKDASGADAPTSRSWRFGFLKRGSDAIDLVDAGTATANHVGTRVRVTGVLEDRQLHVRSLSRVADSCD